MEEVEYFQERVGFSNSSERLDEMMNGWLHDYQTTRALRVLYLDGMSAANSKKGTVDLRDIVLLNQELKNSIMSNMDRATHVCASFSRPEGTESLTV